MHLCSCGIAWTGDEHLVVKPVDDISCQMKAGRATAVAVAGTLHRAAVLAQKEPSVKMRDEKGTDERSFNLSVHRDLENTPKQRA